MLQTSGLPFFSYKSYTGLRYEGGNSQHNPSGHTAQSSGKGQSWSIHIIFQPFHTPKEKTKTTPGQEVILLSIVEIKVQIIGNACTGRISFPTHLAVSPTRKQYRLFRDCTTLSNNFVQRCFFQPAKCWIILDHTKYEGSKDHWHKTKKWRYNLCNGKSLDCRLPVISTV